MSDYTIFVENQAQAFLGGPPLVKMATGEVIGAEDLGGAKVHAMTTGLADQIASDEYDESGLFRSFILIPGYRFDAIHKSREWVASLQARAPSVPGLIQPLAPRYPIEDVVSIVNPDIRKPFDMNEVLLRIVDDSRLSVFKPKYGPNMITASAHVMGKIILSKLINRSLILLSLGFPVGIIANQLSVINPNEAAKATQFIRTCNQQ